MAFLDYAGLQRFKERITPRVIRFTFTGTDAATYVVASLNSREVKGTMVPSITYHGDTSVLTGDTSVSVDDGEVWVSCRLVGTIDIDVTLTEAEEVEA